jgi:hypothetical protein
VEVGVDEVDGAIPIGQESTPGILEIQHTPQGQDLYTVAEGFETVEGTGLGGTQGLEIEVAAA